MIKFYRGIIFQKKYVRIYMIEIKGKYNTAKVFVDDYDKLEEACYKELK